jgi:transcriptional regulator with XRE-family HTH domain
MANKQTISAVLRRAVADGPLSRYAISKIIGVDQGTLSRFVSGQCGLSLESIDKVCELLGLRLVAEGPKRKAKQTKGD